MVSFPPSGVDGVAMLELTRSSSSNSNINGGGYNSGGNYNSSSNYNSGGNNSGGYNNSGGGGGGGGGIGDVNNSIVSTLSGVPVGLAATPVLLISDPEVHASLQQALSQQALAGGGGSHRKHVMRYALGVGGETVVPWFQ